MVIGGSVVTYREVVAYVGPGDIVSGAFGWWGLRAYSEATIGGNAIRLRRSSDNAEQDFVTVGDGSLDVASITSFQGAANLFVVTLYDQVASNDLTNSTAATQPAFTLSAPTTAKPAIDTTAAAAAYVLVNSGPAGTIGADMTTSSVLRYSTGADMISASGSGTKNFQSIRENFAAGANNITIGYGSTDCLSVGGVTTTNNWYTFQALFADPATICVDGADFTRSLGGETFVANTPTNLTLLAYFGGGLTWQGYWAEYGIWSSYFTGGERTDMDDNQRTYWGF